MLINMRSIGLCLGGLMMVGVNGQTATQTVDSGQLLPAQVHPQFLFHLFFLLSSFHYLQVPKLTNPKVNSPLLRPRSLRLNLHNRHRLLHYRIRNRQYLAMTITFLVPWQSCTPSIAPTNEFMSEEPSQNSLPREIKAKKSL